MRTKLHCLLLLTLLSHMPSLLLYSLEMNYSIQATLKRKEIHMYL